MKCSASLHMGLSSTSLDAQPHAGAITYPIKPHEMRTHGYCTVRLRTQGRNISSSATWLPPQSSSKHGINCAQQHGKKNQAKSIQRHDILCGTERSSLSWNTLPMQIISKSAITVYGPQSENSMSFSNRLMIPHWANDRMVCLRILLATSSSTYTHDWSRPHRWPSGLYLAGARWENVSVSAVVLRTPNGISAIRGDAAELRHWYTRIHQRTKVAAATRGARNEFASTGQNNTEMYRSEQMHTRSS